jgi:hypothetical protein
MIASDSIKASLVKGRATKQVTTTDYKAYLNPNTNQLTNFKCSPIQYFRVYSNATITQRFPG